MIRKLPIILSKKLKVGATITIGYITCSERMGATHHIEGAFKTGYQCVKSIFFNVHWIARGESYLHSLKHCQHIIQYWLEFHLSIYSFWKRSAWKVKSHHTINHKVVLSYMACVLLLQAVALGRPFIVTNIDTSACKSNRLCNSVCAGFSPNGMSKSLVTLKRE